ncbi:MAG: Zn-dependent oligopeptidase [Porticoccaceae bacterium]|nr:MAG: Zn-dependent oligopeptidase [Porticoccaceae bacterium]
MRRALAIWFAGLLCLPPASSRAEDLPWLADCERESRAIAAEIERLERLPPPYLAETVLEPLNLLQTRLADRSYEAELMENVHPDPKVRERAARCTTRYAELATRLGLSRPLFEAVRQLDEEELAPDARRYRQLLLRDFRLAGVDRDRPTRERIRRLDERIVRLGQAFDRNLREDVRHLEVPPERLAGLPADVLARLPRTADGKVRLSTRYVDTIPVYTYVHDDEVRRRLRQLDRSRGHPANAEVLAALLRARHERARLVGYPNFADYVTADKMAGSAAAVESFLRRIHRLAQPAAERDLAEMLAELRRLDPTAQRVERWQSAYLEERIRRQRFAVDAAALRRYFPYRRVEAGVLGLAESLFGVEVRPISAPVWHPAVSAYELREGERTLGRFYLDMHPRPGKYQHAATFLYRTGIAGRQLPEAVLVCNFPGGDDPLAPLEFDDVRTFLHEFGHLLHALFGGHQRYARLSGLATEWDFVEAPSQMLEEWLYDPPTLRRFAVAADGAAIPEEAIRRLRSARHFGQGVETQVQVFYAMLSLEYHRRDPEALDLEALQRALEAEFSPFPHQPDTYLFANLGHLNGYSALYYTYLWSKVIALDLFSAFAESTDPRATALRYRHTVLEPGGLVPAGEAVARFLGRPFALDAFARRLAEPGDDISP